MSILSSLKFYSRLVAKNLTKRRIWTLAVLSGDNSYKVIDQPKNFGRADPFPIEIDGKIFIFEEYNAEKKKGIIKVGKYNAKKNCLFDIETVFAADYHVSFPFVFQDRHRIFLIMETNNNKS